MAATKLARSHVEKALMRLFKTAEKAGLKNHTQVWALHPGSPTYGTPWRLYELDDKGGLRALDFLVDGYIGNTAREAHDTLNTINRAWQYFVAQMEEEKE